MFVIQPTQIESILLPLPVSRIPGVGKVTEQRLCALGIRTVNDLQGLTISTLEGTFGRYGIRLYSLARGIDEAPVIADRTVQSISAEDTFEHDVSLVDTEPVIRRLAAKVWLASRQEVRVARTVVLKRKTREFNILTRSYTPSTFLSSGEDLADVAVSLRQRVLLSPDQRFRLVGVGLSNFRDAEQSAAQPVLFD